MELRIKELLKEKGVMHKELAERLGVTLEKVANVLGVAVPELFAAPKEGAITCPHCGKSITIKAE